MILFWDKPAIEILAYISEFFGIFKADLDTVNQIKILNKMYHVQEKT